MPNIQILPASRDSLSKLSDIEGQDRCILTLYFPGGKGQVPNRFDLADLPDRLLSSEGLTDDESEHRQHSIALWRAEMPNVTLTAAPAWISVVSWMTETVVFVPLPAPIEPAAYLDNSPVLYPAGRLLDDLEAYAVVYADHARAVIYVAALGRFEVEDRLRGEIKNHVRKGGWSQQRYERRRDNEIHHYCRALVEKLGEVVENEGLRRIVLMGDQILLVELEKRMAPDLAAKVICRQALQAGEDVSKIFQKTLTAAAEEERREEEWLRDKILGAVGRGKAVVGPHDTFSALNERRVRWLLVGPMEDVEFWRCGSCGSYGLGAPESCPQCGQSTYLQSAANEFTDLTYAGGGRVEFANSDLTDMEGVGALLRW